MDARSSAAASIDAHVGARIVKEHISDKAVPAADTVTQIVMAEQITHDVVKEAQSMGGRSPIDDTATSTSTPAGDGEAPSAPPTANPEPKPLDTTSTNAQTTDGSPGDDIQASDKAGRDAVADTDATETKEALVNGESGEHSATEDSSSHQALGEASGGSDTDISRPGSVDQAKDRNTGHLRSNSVKKPASFKSVSVTKNFLAKSAVSAPTARPGEKAAPAGQASSAAQQTTKPRLVAKSGSGIGNVPRSTLSKANGAGSGPDASKVWNKNQPVTPPPPKQFTDEELKQQYGIHLATRLQADEAGKEAKWADIDDDEDDWAPDTVQWMDGTKSTVPAAVENQPPPLEEPKPGSKRDTSGAATPLQTSVTNSQRPSSTAGTKTILKPGAHAQTSSAKSGLVLKGQAEKPTLVAKPSTASAKSPWAALPPVDKVSPVQINPPVQPPPDPRFSQRDLHGYDVMPPPPVPAKEIAPDDFNRSWRDDRGNRELFNSHNGRYEPVNDMRRGSVRDNSLRQQPSVLQRPSQDGHPEPSAAFQTSRTSADAPAWGRRRNSSNVSGGSGGRMAMDRRVPDIPPMSLNAQRRGSHSINGADAAGLGTPRLPLPQKGPLGDAQHTVSEQQPPWTQKSSPNLSNVQPSSPYGSVQSAGPQDGATPTAPVPMESAVELQNRLMREKLEHAKLAKREAREKEEREEAERKERLRKKLEALAAAEGPTSKTKDHSPSRPVEASPQKAKAVPAQVQSPPKPPVVTSEGEVAQYGMMKVHQPHPVKKPYNPDAAAPKSVKGAEFSPKPGSPPVKDQNELHPAPAASPSGPATQPPTTFTHHNRNNRNNRPPSEQTPAPAQQSEGDARTSSQALKPTQPPPTSWSPHINQPPRPWASNVWGPPQAKDRALGNGTFDSGYNRGQPRPSPPQLPAQSQPGQAPSLGLNPPLKASPSHPQGTPKQPFTQQSVSAQPDTMPPRQFRSAARKAPIALPAGNGWGNFATAIRLDDQAINATAQQEIERVQMGGDVVRHEFQETYRDHKGNSAKTLHGKIGGNAALVNGIKSEISQASAAELKPKDEVVKPTYTNATAATEGPAAQPAFGQGAHLPPSGPAGRSSRFFPKTTDVAAQSSTPIKPDGPSSPPPETQAHPAFTGDAQRPVVKMPKPSPRVRLPPSSVDPIVQPEAQVGMTSRARLGLGARPLALDPEWQARFNSLLDKSTPAQLPAPISKSSSAAQPVVHAKPGALAIAASSKAPLDVRENAASATVSLPHTVFRKPFMDDGSSDITTRSSAEDMLLEEREFGSLPVVNAPKVAHLAANEPPAGFPATRPNFRFQRSLEVQTKAMLNFVDNDRNVDGIDVKVRLTNMPEAVTKTMTKKRDHRDNRKTTGHKGTKRNFAPNNGASNPGQNPRPRKSPNYQGQGSNPNNPPRPSGGNGGNGWNGNRSTPPHNNATWARRAAPVH